MIVAHDISHGLNANQQVRADGLRRRDTPLKLDEALYVSEMVRRIAAILMMGPALDANYRACAAEEHDMTALRPRLQGYIVAGAEDEQPVGRADPRHKAVKQFDRKAKGKRQ